MKEFSCMYSLPRFIQLIVHRVLIIAHVLSASVLEILLIFENKCSVIVGLLSSSNQETLY